MISTLSLSLRSKRFRGFRSKERGTRVKDCAKNAASKIAGRFLPSPPSPPSFNFWLSFHFLRGKNRRLSLPWNHSLLSFFFSIFSLLSTLFSISAQLVWLAEEGREGGEKITPLYPSPQPGSTPNSRLRPRTM